jgi:glycine cleavage system H protein
MVVEGLSYSKEHEWVKIEGDEAVVGITDYAQQMLGEITYVELPEVGKEAEAGDELAVVESSKAASDVYAPLSGKVSEVNSELEEKPELINGDCYEKGWIYKVAIKDKKEAGGLMNSKQYEEYLKGL